MKTRLTQRNYRSKRRSCPLCKPNKMHGDDSRDIRTVRESFGHAQQLREAEPWWTEKGFDKSIAARCIRDKALDLQREAQRLSEAARILETTS